MEAFLKESISWDTKYDKYSKTEIIPCILSDYYGTKLKMDNKENSTKFINLWRLEISPLFTEWWLGQRINQEEIKIKFLGLNENEDISQQVFWGTLETVLKRNS